MVQLRSKVVSWCLLAVLLFGVSPAVAQNFPTFNQRRDWLFGLTVPTSQISGSGKYGMPFAIAKLWQTNGSNYANDHQKY